MKIKSIIRKNTIKVKDLKSQNIPTCDTENEEMVDSTIVNNNEESVVNDNTEMVTKFTEEMLEHFAEVISTKIGNISEKNANIIPNYNFTDKDEVLKLIKQLPDPMLMIIQSIVKTSDECDEYYDRISNPFNVLYGILTQGIIEDRGEWSYFISGLAQSINTDIYYASASDDQNITLVTEKSLGSSEILRSIYNYTDYDIDEVVEGFGLKMEWDDDYSENDEEDEDVETESMKVKYIAEDEEEEDVITPEALLKYVDSEPIINDPYYSDDSDDSETQE